MPSSPASNSTVRICILNESIGDRRLSWLIVNQLLRGLKGSCSISSIVPGLGGKVFTQFLFHNFELIIIFCLTKVEYLILKTDSWSMLLCCASSSRSRRRGWILIMVELSVGSTHPPFNNFDETLILLYIHR